MGVGNPGQETAVHSQRNAESTDYYAKRRKSVPQKGNAAGWNPVAVACEYRIERTGLVDRFPMGRNANENSVQNEK